jgi:hypothetical protein
MEKTKQAIDMYYTIRTLIPDMFENIHPNLPQMQELMDIAYCTILPRLTNDIYRVFAFKMRNEHLIDKMEPHNVMGLLHNIQELRLKEDVMFGDILILDMKGINMGYLAKLTPSIVSKFLTIYEVSLKQYFFLGFLANAPFSESIFHENKSRIRYQQPIIY